MKIGIVACRILIFQEAIHNFKEKYIPCRKMYNFGRKCMPCRKMYNFWEEMYAF